jgi:hypothetical protein
VIIKEIDAGMARAIRAHGPEKEGISLCAAYQKLLLKQQRVLAMVNQGGWHGLAALNTVHSKGGLG